MVPRLLCLLLLVAAGSATVAQVCDPLPARESIAWMDIHARPSAASTRRRTPAASESPFGGLLQITNPPAPNEKDWVLAAGNETQVDSVLSMSLSLGGRLVSIGFFNLQNMVQYYAIMHKYSGPVFTKPPPMSVEQLIQAVKDNSLRDLALTQVSGQESNGHVVYGTYWEYVPGIRQEIWFPGSPQSEEQRRQFEALGLRLTYLTGFTVGGQPRYVGVWSNLPESRMPYEAHYGLPLKACLEKNEELARRSFVARRFSVFQVGAELLCTGIWEYAVGHRHFIRVGTDLRTMHAEFAAMPAVLPRQISHYLSGPTTVQYVVLWSDTNTARFHRPPVLWNATSRIPVSFLHGTTSLLRPHQLAFAVGRIENFMKMYDLPALSIAIGKHERLKFAAAFGYTDLRTREMATTESLFRIGSVSKPITAAAVLMLVDRGALNLDMPIFGPGTLFGMDYAGPSGYGQYVDRVTTRHLLEHTTGGWDNEEGDVAWSMPKVATDTLVKAVLVAPLPGPPGHKWVYSNFGYVLLGRIIERISRMSYEDFVYNAVLLPSGAKDAFIARGSIAERRPKEVMYYMSGTSIGFDPYDMLAPDRIGPWGGWVSNPVQLLKFLAAVDGSNVRPDLISTRSVIEWATPSVPSNRSYGLGWSINVMGFNGWQHDGRMPGASSMLVRLASGHSMAVTTNMEFVAREFFHDMAYLLHHLVHQCDWWNDLNDLFAYT